VDPGDSIVKHVRIALHLFLICVAASGAAHAQASRTWVSGVGDDANPCSRTAPCKTFAGAIPKTAAGGEIDVLDPGGFGAVTVTKAISIDGGGGVVASTSAAGTNGIVISAGVNDVVILRNLKFLGLARSPSTAGLNGIQLNSAAALHIDHCVIDNFGQNGIQVAPSAGSQVFIDNSVSRGNVGNGLNIMATNTEVRVSITNSHFTNNANGVFSGDFSKTTIATSDASGNSQSGFVALGNGGPATLNLIDSTASNNAGNGVVAGGGANTSRVRMTNVSTLGNATGLVIATNGTIYSYGDNKNSGGGVPTTTLTQQ
jgi:Right handed beta helix region